MSDYVRQKVIRYPVEPSYFEINRLGDLDDNKKYKDLLGYAQPNRFQVAPTDKGFIDYVLLNKYSEGSDDWGKTRELTEKEKDKYRPLFQKIIPDVDMDKARLVDYCWYNCCEAPNYYEITTDSFYDEV